MDLINEIIDYTDGACSGNHGPGGWGVVLRAKVKGKIVRERLLSGGCEHTTNNRMELRAAIEALKALKKPTKIIIVTDSTYVKEGLNNWMKKWKSNGWRIKITSQ